MKLAENTSYALYIVPDTPETRSFADHMQEYWSSQTNLPLPGQGPFLPLNFVFLETEEELVAIYANDTLAVPVKLAILFDGNPLLEMSVTLVVTYIRMFVIAPVVKRCNFD